MRTAKEIRAITVISGAFLSLSLHSYLFTPDTMQPYHPSNTDWQTSDLS